MAIFGNHPKEICFLCFVGGASGAGTPGGKPPPKPKVNGKKDAERQAAIDAARNSGILSVLKPGTFDSLKGAGDLTKSGKKPDGLLGVRDGEVKRNAEALATTEGGGKKKADGKEAATEGEDKRAKKKEAARTDAKTRDAAGVSPSSKKVKLTPEKARKNYEKARKNRGDTQEVWSKAVSKNDKARADVVAYGTAQGWDVGYNNPKDVVSVARERRDETRAAVDEASGMPEDVVDDAKKRSKEAEKAYNAAIAYRDASNDMEAKHNTARKATNAYSKAGNDYLEVDTEGALAARMRDGAEAADSKPISKKTTPVDPEAAEEASGKYADANEAYVEARGEWHSTIERRDKAKGEFDSLGDTEKKVGEKYEDAASTAGNLQVDVRKKEYALSLAKKREGADNLVEGAQRDYGRAYAKWEKAEAKAKVAQEKWEGVLEQRQDKWEEMERAGADMVEARRELDKTTSPRNEAALRYAEVDPAGYHTKMTGDMEAARVAAGEVAGDLAGPQAERSYVENGVTWYEPQGDYFNPNLGGRGPMASSQSSLLPVAIGGFSAFVMLMAGFLRGGGGGFHGGLGGQGGYQHGGRGGRGWEGDYGRRGYGGFNFRIG